ncbi:MAG: [FeFe] hydrogenase, group A, partial [Symbiobacteriaceae bacterium]|nr:[FeFe] hydrogenase, group A [Symbiobacteriaceae bacterium]
PLGSIECVNCGQCIKICPVGALSIKPNIEQVWDAIYDPAKTVVVQVAPAVRVALGEYFGFKPGTVSIGQIVTSLRLMGFNKVFDTSFGADLTVVEEGKEFLGRVQRGEDLPQFTSCCPAWIKFAEQYYPDMLGNLSSCRSPQQMFGSLVKDKLPADLGISRENLVMVSVMPCTAKKFEANRPEFKVDGNPDVDIVITTAELGLMIKESGIRFDQIEPGSFDMPFGFKTGAGVIFGSSGGVTEAVLRYAAAQIHKGVNTEFKQLRNNHDTRVVEVDLGDRKLRMALVSGLANARELIDSIRSGEEHFDLVEVMACRGGCVNGGGQPEVQHSQGDVITARAGGLYTSDVMSQFHNSGDNPYIRDLYAKDLTEERAHHLLHTVFSNRSRIITDAIALSTAKGERKLSMSICFGTSCFLRGSQDLYTRVMGYLREKGLDESTEFTASFCGNICKKGPVLEVNGQVLEQCTFEMAVEKIEAAVGDNG